MEEKQIKELIKLFDNSSLADLKLKKDNFSLSLSKNSTVVPNIITNNIPAQVPTQNIENINEVANNNIKVKSPMVGTFYSASNPEAKPFVSVGDKVKKGSVIGIIEAMKIMNEIEADFDMKIVDVLVQNSGAVEFDMPIFEVEKI